MHMWVKTRAHACPAGAPAGEWCGGAQEGGRLSQETESDTWVSHIAQFRPVTGSVAMSPDR